MDADALKKMTEAEIIELAARELGDEDNGFDPAIFDRVSVKERGDSYWVSFAHSVRYVPPNSAHYYATGCDLLEGLSVTEQDSNPQDANIGASEFFKHDEESRAATAFVLKALEGTGEVELDEKGRLDPDTIVKIRPDGDVYHIELVADCWDMTCTVDKATGEVDDIIIGEFHPKPNSR